MIGTTFKLGFDAGQVKTGLHSIKGMLGRGLRQVGIGAARQVGVGMTDMMGRIVSAFPEAAKEALDWSGSLYDMSKATKISVRDLILFQETLRNTGFEGDPTKALVTFTDQLYEAAHGSEEAQEAFRRLGLNKKDFVGKGTMESVNLVAQRMKSLGDTLENPGGILGQLFGGKAGFRFISAFKDLSGELKNTETYMGPLLDDFVKMTEAGDELGDMVGRFAMTRRSLAMGFLEGLGGKDLKGTKSLVDSMFVALNSLRPMMVSIGQLLRPIIDSFASTMKIFSDPTKLMESVWSIATDLQKGFFDLGASIGEGIKSSIQDIIPGSGIGKGISNMKNSVMEYFSPSSKDKKTSMIGGGALIDETKTQTTILEKIYNKNAISMFA